MGPFMLTVPCVTRPLVLECRAKGCVKTMDIGKYLHRRVSELLQMTRDPGRRGFTMSSGFKGQFAERTFNCIPLGVLALMELPSVYTLC